MDYSLELNTKGFDKLTSGLKKLVRSHLNIQMMKVGDKLLDISSKEVPHDQGILQASGSASVEESGDEVWAEVGYHTPYALRLHEHPEYKFQKGRKGKYLEDPLKVNLRTWGDYIATAINKAIFDASR